MKLDKKFYADVVYIRKAKDHSIVSDEEWVVFLAKDNAFAAVLPLYYEACEKMGADEEQLAAVTRLIDDVAAWRLANPERCKVPDAKGEKLLP
jgi:isocitrate/isopropylmalate dehydrogenase